MSNEGEERNCVPKSDSVNEGQALNCSIKSGTEKPEDPWKHRASGMRCDTCMWFVPKYPEPNAMNVTEQQPQKIGRCRRHAPNINGFPVVFNHDWCGDHRLDENKI